MEDSFTGIVNAAADQDDSRHRRRRTPQTRFHKQRPRWARRLARMLEYLAGVAATQGDGSIAERMVAPAVGYARSQLQHRLCGRRSHDYRIVISSFEQQLTRMLIETAKRAIDFHFRAFEAASHSLALTHVGCATDDLENLFFENYGRRVISLFRSFPALARVWSEILCQWTTKVGELVNRIHTDRTLICKTFFENCGPGRVRGIAFDISDPHNGGRETVILRFDHGYVVYKPRRGDNERAWFSLLRWINRQGSFPQFQTLHVLCRRRYCWVEHVAPESCRSVVQVKNYYCRAGGLLCITYLIGAIDCHCDNLIAAGDQPMLIDAETLLHRQPESPVYKGAAGLLRTGLLPIPKDTDVDMNQVSGFSDNGAGPNTPMLNHRAVPLSAHSSEIVRGFRDMWKLLTNATTPAASGFLRQIRALEKLQWRRVYFPTSRYIAVRNASLDPLMLRSGRRRRQTIEDMLRRNGISESILRRETRALLNLDIPYFKDRPSANFGQAGSLPLPRALKWIRSTARRA